MGLSKPPMPPLQPVPKLPGIPPVLNPPTRNTAADIAKRDDAARRRAAQAASRSTSLLGGSYDAPVKPKTLIGGQSNSY